eukprot:gene21270-25558_t
MGLGKTLTTIALLYTLLKQGPHGTPVIKRAVIVCPASLVMNWAAEVKKWLGDMRLSCLAVQGGNPDAQQQVTSWATKLQQKWPVLITSYEMVRKFNKDIASAQPGLLICDEAHRLKKAAGNKTIDALNGLRCQRRILLTGTPIQNDLNEFFAMMDFCCPNLFGPLSSFNHIFGRAIQKSRDRLATEEEKVIGRERSAELTRLSAPVLLRRTAEVNAKYLPRRTQYVVYCALSQIQQQLYIQLLT